MTTGSKKRLLKGLGFISPWIIGFLVFTLYPVVMSLYYSFTYYNTLMPPIWIGVRNYAELIKDDLFWVSIRKTIYYVFTTQGLAVVIGVSIASLLNVKKVKGISIFRTVIYLPNVVPLVAMVILWGWLFNSNHGLINLTLKALKLPTPGWLGDPFWAMPALIIMNVWLVGRPVIIYLAGLQGVPQELHEAAIVDGANAFQRFVSITLPMLSPAILFNVVIGLIYGFQYFAQPFILTRGGPNQATYVYALYLYNNAFQFLRMGYASAQAWILFVMVLVVTLAVMKFSSRWVYYGGGE